MCNENWNSKEDSNEFNDTIEVDNIMVPAQVEHLGSNAQSSALVVENALPTEDFQNLFAARNYSIMPMPQYVIRMQQFEFRRQSIEYLTALYDRWLTRQSSHDSSWLLDNSCDVCGINVDGLSVLPLFLKHISCGHSICSTCLVTKRFIFVNLGLPICCNTCKSCWLQF